MRRAVKKTFQMWIFSFAAILALSCLLISPRKAHAQGTVQGQEKVITYTGTNASLAPPNTSAGNFTSPNGLNTFILPIANPTVSIRVYLTNDTANACTGAFTIQMFASTDAAVSTFNGSLATWQTVPLQDPSGTLASIVGPLSLPASAAVYVSSTAISAPKVAIQIVNVNAACTTTTIEAFAVVTQVAVTSPLISATTNNAFGTSPTNVQGVIPSSQNSAPVFPVLAGAALPAINQQFLNQGVDNFTPFGAVITSVTAGTSGNVNFGNPPLPTARNDWALAIFTDAGGAVAGSFNSPPWTCVAAVGSCNASGSGGLHVASLMNVSASNTLFQNFANANVGKGITQFIEFATNGTAPVVRQARLSINVTSLAFSSNTLAGSTILMLYDCATSTNGFNPGSSTTDTQGVKYNQVTFTATGQNNVQGLTSWIGGPSSAAGDTLTFTNPNTCSTTNTMVIMELTGIIPANLNTPLDPINSSNNKFLTGQDDNGGQFMETGGFHFTQTVTLATAATTTQSLWQQSQHGLFFSCTMGVRATAVSGTTPTLNIYLQDSPDNVGFNDRLAFPQIIATGNFLGAISGGSGGITPAATTDAALAAGSKLDGPVDAFGRLKFVVGGTGPSFTITYDVGCR